MTNPQQWIGFHAVLVFLLAVEWLMSRRVRDTHRRALYATVMWVFASAVLALWISVRLGTTGAVQYLAGYAIEQALSMDNLFLFLLLFQSFAITPEHQPKVLFWGVLGAIVLRGLCVAAGIGLLQRFHWVEYVFGVVLLVAAVRLLFPGKQGETGNAQGKPPAWLRWLTRVHPVSASQKSFFARENGRLLPTVLLLALVAVEFTDIVFALDSIPAVLSITRMPFLAYTSNIMAVMGLRSLYVLLASLLTRLRFLHFGLAALLSFAALKMLAAPWFEVGPLVSLLIIVLMLAITVAASLLSKTPHQA